VDAHAYGYPLWVLRGCMQIGDEELGIANARANKGDAKIDGAHVYAGMVGNKCVVALAVTNVTVEGRIAKTGAPAAGTRKRGSKVRSFSINACVEIAPAAECRAAVAR
jgi:hypothetical protein